MNCKPTVITNLSYRRVGQEKQLRELARYFQFRDGSLRRDAYLRGEGYGGPERNDAVHLQGRETKWVDRGMGETYQQVTNRAQELSGRTVLARTWVISPDPDLMMHIPEQQRLEVMQRLTERTVELWYDDNEWGQPQYSYVLHTRDTNDDGRQQLHAHVITPGTIPLEPDLGRIDHIVKRPHIRDLRQVAEETFEREMEHALGRERARHILMERERQLLHRHMHRTMHAAHDDAHEYALEYRHGYSHGLTSLLQMRRHRPGQELRQYARYLRRKAALDRRRIWEARRRKWVEEYQAELAQARQEEIDRQARIAQQRERNRPEEQLKQEPVPQPLERQGPDLQRERQRERDWGLEL